MAAILFYHSKTKHHLKTKLFWPFEIRTRSVFEPPLYLTSLYSCLFFSNYASFLNKETPPITTCMHSNSRASIHPSHSPKNLLYRPWNRSQTCLYFLLALETLGYADFKKDAEEVMNECRDVAAKRRRQSTRLENLVSFSEKGSTLVSHLLQDLKVLVQTSIKAKNLLNYKWCGICEIQNMHHIVFVARDLKL